MKYSKQRELIHNTLMDHQIHPTADTIYSIVREQNPTISLGTVYRNLNMLADNGRIMRISVPNGGDRFDGRCDEHYHIICEVCGELSDMEINFPEELDKEIRSKTEFQVTGHQLLISGICKKCQAKAEQRMDKKAV